MRIKDRFDNELQEGDLVVATSWTIDCVKYLVKRRLLKVVSFLYIGYEQVLCSDENLHFPGRLIRADMLDDVLTKHSELVELEPEPS